VDLAPPLIEASLDVAATRIGTAVLVQGSLKGRFNVVCSRCLGPALVKVEEPDLQVTFLPPNEEKVQEELSADDLNTYVHDGEVIDLESLLREVLILAIPLAPLCQPDCKGICTSCGIDLNREACTCRGQSTNMTPWAAALSQLKEQGKKTT